MIGTIWPWARVAPKQRTFLWLAILLISASGLLTGLVVRPLIHTTGGGTPPVSRGTTPIIATTPTANTPTATLAPAVTTPQQFTIMLDVPTPTTQGATMTIITHASVTVNGQMKPAQGVVCQITFTPMGGIPFPSEQTTDISGTATFAVAIPATTPPGDYTVHVRATWGGGGFAANWDALAKITRSP